MSETYSSHSTRTPRQKLTPEQVLSWAKDLLGEKPGSLRLPSSSSCERFVEGANGIFYRDSKGRIDWYRTGGVYDIAARMHYKAALLWVGAGHRRDTNTLEERTSKLAEKVLDAMGVRWPDGSIITAFDVERGNRACRLAAEKRHEAEKRAEKLHERRKAREARRLKM